MSSLKFWRKYATKEAEQRDGADLIIPAKEFLEITQDDYREPYENAVSHIEELYGVINSIAVEVMPFTHMDDGPLYRIRKLINGLDSEIKEP